MAAFADESETEINLKNKQSGAASGGGDVHNCAENDLESDHANVGPLVPYCSDVTTGLGIN